MVMESYTVMLSYRQSIPHARWTVGRWAVGCAHTHLEDTAGHSSTFSFSLLLQGGVRVRGWGGWFRGFVWRVRSGVLWGLEHGKGVF